MIKSKKMAGGTLGGARAPNPPKIVYNILGLIVNQNYGVYKDYISAMPLIAKQLTLSAKNNRTLFASSCID